MIPWNDLSKLSIYNGYLLFAAAAVGIIAGVLALAIWKVGVRIGELQDAQTQESQRQIALANENAQNAILGQKTIDAKLATTQNENLKLAAKYEEEKTARLRLEEKVAPRRLSSTNKRAIADAMLAALHGREVIGQIDIDAWSGVVDGHDLADDLSDALKLAGIKSVFNEVVNGGNLHGVRIRHGRNAAELADKLSGALSNAGIQTSLKFDSTDPLAFAVEIGTKP